MDYRQKFSEHCKAHPFDSSATHVQRILLDAIISGELPSGTVLNQSELATGFDLSRTPIRQALNELISDGYVSKNDQGGYQVYEFNPDDYSELTQFRIQLETLSIRMAALYQDERVIARLKSSQCDMELASKNNDRHAALKADNDFHTTLIYASRNLYVINAYLQYTKKIEFFRILLSSKQSFTSTFRLHEKIVKSIEERNPDAGIRYLKQHLMLSDELARLNK